MQAALANPALLRGRLAGLNNARYLDALRLRPGLSCTRPATWWCAATWTCPAIATTASIRRARGRRWSARANPVS